MFFFALLVVAVSHARAVPPPGYQLVWDDEFNGTFLNLHNWNYEAGAHRQAINTPDAVSVYDGTLKINTYLGPGRDDSLRDN